jgi:hypothetical protein
MMNHPRSPKPGDLGHPHIEIGGFPPSRQKKVAKTGHGAVGDDEPSQVPTAGTWGTRVSTLVVSRLRDRKKSRRRGTEAGGCDTEENGWGSGFVWGRLIPGSFPVNDVPQRGKVAVARSYSTRSLVLRSAGPVFRTLHDPSRIHPTVDDAYPSNHRTAPGDVKSFASRRCLHPAPPTIYNPR